MSLQEFSLRPDDFDYIEADFNRPECILATSDGTVWAADARGGIAVVSPSGAYRRIGSCAGTPNGFVLEPDGSFIIADIDGERFVRLGADGRCATLLETLEGERLGAANFVYRDTFDRLWATVSTRLQPRGKALDESASDGFILQYREGAFRRVANNLCFVNEIRVDAGGRYLYAAETGRGRILRWSLTNRGELGAREIFGPDPIRPGAWIDGITFDSAGNLWLTEVKRNGIYALDPSGALQCIFEDPAGAVLDFPASLAFSGPDLRTVLIGSIRMNRIARFRSPIAGAPPSHWNVSHRDLTPRQGRMDGM